MNKKSNKSIYLVQSVQRAVLLLEALANKEAELRIAELSRKTNLNQSTVYRLLGTLRNLNCVEQNPDTHKYRLTLKLFELGSSVINKFNIVQRAIPHMEALSRKYNEAVNLAKLDKDEIVYIHKIESYTTLKLDLKLGSRHPAYCTGLGKILLAYLEEDELDSYLKRIKLKRFTPNTIVDKEELKKELIMIKQKGYSFDSEEYVQGVCCLAASVRDYNNKVCASLSIAIPSIRLKDNNIPLMIRNIIATTNEISCQRKR
jgi:IclR family KDG regulon transcriptional repressor